MSATELRTDKLAVPKNSADVARLLQRVLSLRGLVSFSVSKEGVEIKRYRNLHDPPISDQSPIAEPELNVALAMLEDIHELEDSPSIELAILRAAQHIGAAGFVPSALILPSTTESEIFKSILPDTSVTFSDEADTFLFGYRVAVSDLLAEGTMLMLGSLVSTYHYDSVRMAVRIFTKEFLNGNDTEEEGGNYLTGETAAAA